MSRSRKQSGGGGGCAAPVKPRGTPLTRAAVRRVLREIAPTVKWTMVRWEVTEEVDDPGLLPAREGIYFVVEKVRSGDGGRTRWVARYIGQSQDVRRRAKTHRAQKWLGDCEGCVVFFALVMPAVQEPGRKWLEKVLHDVFKPDVSST